MLNLSRHNSSTFNNRDYLNGSIVSPLKMHPSDNYGYADEYGNRGAMDQNIQINYPSHAQMFESDIE